MRRPIKYLIPTVGASLLLAACGSSSSKPAATANPTNASNTAALVKTAPSPKLGATVLVDAQGRTLYHLSVEQGGKFICTSSACVNIWHPLTVAAGSKPSGTVGSLSEIKRPGGGLQVTYKGMPLYTFAQDTSAGQVNGQGVKDVGTWTAVTASHTSSSAASTPAAPASSSGGAYAY